MSLTGHLELVERKTGDVFRLSCWLGAGEARAGEDAARVAWQFGADFQIMDDCLDLGTRGTGKPVGTNHLLGLFGAPTLYALAADSSGSLAALPLSPRPR